LDYRSLFESAPSLHLVLTPAFEIVAVTDAYLNATMTQRQQILGHHIFEMFPDNPDDPLADGVRVLRASLERVLQTRVPDTMAVQKYDIRRPESLGGGFEERYWSPLNSPVLDSEGSVAYIIHRVEDVTEFVKVKEQLRNRTQDIAESGGSGNPAPEMFARSQELGDVNRKLKNANEGLRNLYREVASMVAKADDELQLFGDQRSPTLVDPDHLNPEELLTQVARLINGHKRMEDELRQAQKMEAVGRLAGGIAHDFNNLLTIILGYCNILLARVNTSDSNYRKLCDIRDAGEKASELTGQLLVFSRKQVLEPKVISLVTMLRDMDRMLRRVLGEDVEVATIVDGEPGQVRIDPSQAQQVLMNLVVNSRDAMPRGGKLTLELRNSTLDSGTATHYGIPSGNYVVLAVTDNGIGMEPDVRQHIFEPFFTTKNANQGTGLGLSTVYGIVKQSGGHIWLYSEPGAGTTFKIFFPRVDQTADLMRDTPNLNLATGTETLLIVEDDDLIRALVQEVLVSAGYTAFSARSGEDALRVFERSPKPIDLLLTDVVLPKMSGKEIADHILQQSPGIKVLFMSGYTGNAMIHRDVLSEPKIEFLQKPFTPQTLCRKVRDVLDAGPLPLRRILIVDDIPAVLDLLGSLLEDSGFDVIKASNGREAREKALAHAPDIVLTDLSMPEEEGIETIRALRIKHPDLKIIAMSGAFGPEILQSAKSLGADATLAKPINSAKLRECIQSLSKTIRPRSRE
jgi:signal transduction histidine kinase/DNA-binding response OmpR family regulator